MVVLAGVTLAVLAVGWWWTRCTSSGPPPQALSPRRGTGPLPRVQRGKRARFKNSPEQAAIAVLVQEALAEVQQLTARFPRHAEACHAAAVAHYELGTLRDRSGAVLEPRPGAGPKGPRHVPLAGLRGDGPGPVSAGRRVLSPTAGRVPASADARLGLAETCVGLGDMPAARRLLEQEAKAAQPGSGTGPARRRGRSVLELHDYGPAKESFLKAARLMPRAPQPYYGLSLACARFGEADQSADYQRRFRSLAAQERRAPRDTAQPCLRDLAEARVKAAGILTALAETYTACGKGPEAELSARVRSEIRQAGSTEERRHARP